MTAKDYNLIAGILGGLKETANQNGHSATFEIIVRNLSIALEMDNPRFQPNLFLKACGVK